VAPKASKNFRGEENVQRALTFFNLSFFSDFVKYSLHDISLSSFGASNLLSFHKEEIL